MTVMSITVTADKTRVDPGEAVRVDLYIDGAGVVDDHHLTVHAPEGLLADGFEVRSYRYATGSNLPQPSVVLPAQLDQMQNRFQGSFNKYYFVRGPNGTLNCASYVTEDGVNHAPLAVRFAVAKKAPPGEHAVKFLFIYSGAGSSGIAEGAATIVVRSFAERHREFLGAALAISTFLLPLAIGGLPTWLRLPVGAVGAGLLLSILLLLTRK